MILTIPTGDIFSVSTEFIVWTTSWGIVSVRNSASSDSLNTVKSMKSSSFISNRFSISSVPIHTCNQMFLIGPIGLASGSGLGGG